MQWKIDTKSGVITVLQHSSTKPSESPPCLQEKKPLLKDPSDPAKYADILVCKKRERECLLVAKQSKTPGIQLINSTLSLVFTDEELGESSGMGLKRHKGNAGKPVLDSLKIEAIKEYVNYHCKYNNWECVSSVAFNNTVSNKIGNVRKKMKKSPQLISKIVH